MAEERARILIVDDEKINVWILDEMLRDRYDTSVALNGEQALKRALALRPDMILLDIQMSGMNGYQVCQQLKENEATSDIPVIFITAMDGEDDEQKGLELGAVDYITKPFRPAIVQARLHNHLEMKRQRDLLDRLSSLDGLTGIANRRRLESFIELEWRRAVRSGDWLAVVLMDIDHFKHYNDHYGHIAGDECLRLVARTVVAELTRRTDLAARYGGEEFICILPATDPEGAARVAERIRTAIQMLRIPHASSPTHEFVTLSLGVAAWQPRNDGTKPSDLVALADRRLYRAKEEGRNRVVT